MSVFDHPDFDDHQQVVFVSDPAANLRAIIAIHSTGSIGLAGGGCRMFPYETSDAALRDVLRLSRAMTYKLALAGLPAGGGKAVVLGDPEKDKSQALLKALGRAVQQLGGRFVIGEDVGTNAGDMAVIAEETPFVTRSIGLQDTSVPTAWGTFTALETCVHHRLERSDLKGVRVAVQGVGAVGFRLCRHLAEAGAKLLVADVDEDAVENVVATLSATRVSPDEIHAATTSTTLRVRWVRCSMNRPSPRSKRGSSAVLRTTNWPTSAAMPKHSEHVAFSTRRTSS